MPCYRGASFIGSHLVESLLDKGADVRVADDLSSGKLEHLSGVISDIEFLRFAGASGCVIIQFGFSVYFNKGINPCLQLNFPLYGLEL